METVVITESLPPAEGNCVIIVTTESSSLALSNRRREDYRHMV